MGARGHRISQRGREPFLLYFYEMSYPASPAAPSLEMVAESRRAITPRILRLADGDVVFAAQIRTMMWGEYCAAGAPFGQSEDGMMVWWGERLGDLPE